MNMPSDVLATPIPRIPFEPLVDLKEPLAAPEVEVEPLVETLEEVKHVPAVPEVLPLYELEKVDRLLITKRLAVKKMIFLRGKKNRYIVRAPDQSVVYTVQEENSWWVGYLCYGLRPLQLKVMDGRGQEAMRISRPFACTARVFPCALQRLQNATAAATWVSDGSDPDGPGRTYHLEESKLTTAFNLYYGYLKIYSPPGTLIGTVEQQWSAIKPLYVIRDETGKDVFWLKGPLNTMCLFRDVQFDIVRPNGAYVGATCKRWQGMTHALLFAPVTDRFGVAFERNLSVREKGLLLAITLLVDYMYYDV